MTNQGQMRLFPFPLLVFRRNNVRALKNGERLLRQKPGSLGNLETLQQQIAQITTLTTGLWIWRRYGSGAAIRYLMGLSLALLAQRMFLVTLMRKTGQIQGSLADVLTLSRATTGSILLGLVASGIRDRRGQAGRASWLLLLFAATVTDWLDGPLARWIGATRLGKTLDIEADSWLTLWSAASAISWGDLPSWCLVPPLLRYLDPLLDGSRRELSQGGGPWWSRLTGSSQMVLFLAALSPWRWPWRKQSLIAASALVSGAQATALLVLLWRKLRER